MYDEQDVCKESSVEQDDGIRQSFETPNSFF